MTEARHAAARRLIDAERPGLTAVVALLTGGDRTRLLRTLHEGLRAWAAAGPEARADRALLYGAVTRAALGAAAPPAAEGDSAAVPPRMEANRSPAAAPCAATPPTASTDHSAAAALRAARMRGPETEDSAVAALALLPALPRALAILRLRVGLSAPEAARALGLTPERAAREWAFAVRQLTACPSAPPGAARPTPTGNATPALTPACGPPAA